MGEVMVKGTKFQLSKVNKMCLKLSILFYTQNLL